MNPNITFLIMLVAMMALMFFMQRSQKKQAQARQDQLKALQKGDEIVTIGGLYGVVDEVDTANQKMVLDIDGVYLTFELGALKRVVNRAEQEVVEEVVEETTEAAQDTAVESED